MTSLSSTVPPGEVRPGFDSQPCRVAGEERVLGVAARLLLGLIRAYQLTVSPWLGSACRFAPSCSCYARDAIARYGAVRGLMLGARRLARCHPFHPGGWDPVR